MTGLAEQREPWGGGGREVGGGVGGGRGSTEVDLVVVVVADGSEMRDLLFEVAALAAVFRVWD